MSIIVNTKIRSLSKGVIKFNLEVSNIKSEDLINEKGHFKLLLNRKNKNNPDHYLLVKILIPKKFEMKFTTIDRYAAKINKNTVISKNHHGYIINYSNDFHIDELEKYQNSFIISIAEINLGIKFKFSQSLIKNKSKSKELSKSNTLHKTELKKAREQKKLIIKQNRKDYLYKKNLLEKDNNNINSTEQTGIMDYNKSNKESHSEIKNKKPVNTPKIWIAKDTAFKRCGHCISFNSTYNKCSRHKKNVSKDNGCKDFYYPKIYLGGAMSPR